MADRLLPLAQIRARKTSLWPALFATLVVLISGSTLGQSAAQARRQPVAADRRVSPVTLHNLTPLQEAFRRDQGNVRLVVLVSPT